MYHNINDPVVFFKKDIFDGFRYAMARRNRHGPLYFQVEVHIKGSGYFPAPDLMGTHHIGDGCDGGFNGQKLLF